MGAALWRRVRAQQVVDAASEASAPRGQVRYRIEVFGQPRAPWRAYPSHAMDDAIRLGLASWDADRNEHFLAVPVDMRTWLIDGQGHSPCGR
jgi:hypothetical protein